MDSRARMREDDLESWVTVSEEPAIIEDFLVVPSIASTAEAKEALPPAPKVDIDKVDVPAPISQSAPGIDEKIDAILSDMVERVVEFTGKANVKALPFQPTLTAIPENTLLQSAPLSTADYMLTLRKRPQPTDVEVNNAINASLDSLYPREELSPSLSYCASRFFNSACVRTVGRFFQDCLQHEGSREADSDNDNEIALQEATEATALLAMTHHS